MAVTLATRYVVGRRNFMCQLRLLFSLQDRQASDRIQNSHQIRTLRMASAKPKQVGSSSAGAKALAQANNHLAVNLHRLLAEEKCNVFFSPFSISTAMAMLLSAAEGETEAEMRNALGYDHAGVKREDIASVFKEQMSVLSNNPDSYTLACANALLSQEGFEIKEEYKSILSDSFKALLMEVDFAKDGEKAANVINEWVKEETRNMIPKLVESIDSSTVMVLMNAVYFKGSWSQKFNESNTSKQQFCNRGSEENTTEVDMMYMEEEFPFTENESFQALQLPYSGEDVAMLIILPHSNVSLDTVESSLSPTFVQDIKSSMRKQKVEVHLPRFRLEYSKSLVQCFQTLGVAKVFGRGAELGKASDSTDLAVSEIFHKAVLEVNEEGSEAAAATMIAVMMCALIFSPVFRADHPFAFIIYDTRSDLILFMGRVEEF